MTQQIQQVLVEALRLPESERADLAAKLIESLETTAETDVEASWSVEIQQRLGELESSRVQPITWPEARRMIMEDTNDGSGA